MQWWAIRWNSRDISQEHIETIFMVKSISLMPVRAGFLHDLFYNREDGSGMSFPKRRMTFTGLHPVIYQNTDLFRVGLWLCPISCSWNWYWIRDAWHAIHDMRGHLPAVFFKPLLPVLVAWRPSNINGVWSSVRKFCRVSWRKARNCRLATVTCKLVTMASAHLPQTRQQFSLLAISNLSLQVDKRNLVWDRTHTIVYYIKYIC